MPPRASLASPAPVTASEPEYYSSSASDRRKAHQQPPAAPPRTSSSQGASSRRTTAHAPDRGVASPRRDTNVNMDGARASDTNSPSRSRRHQQGPQDTPTRPSSNRDARTTAKSPSREASEILSRMVISQPEVDVQRERERLEESVPHPVSDLRGDAAPPPVVGMAAHQEEPSRRGRSRQDHSKREKVQRFGDYYLGNTIGEGEFGKVKLGWKQHGGVQVAIKLIRKDTVGNNPTRLAKIHREVQILKGLQHPNIVRLHEMSETERHIGIVLEYASGGELFDYILNHRYLKDNAARRLFAQLISGVGYLHKKGIVHRDLKLENLLLDRNKNIIITDFGFANTFDPVDELNEEQEENLLDKDFVKRQGLDKLKSNGMRKGDLMQTSCGSPCYAAPELVVSDSLYTGRKVDVWSCGVILYAMLAGYLPFDDDPANPEGDNINLLYKYIVSTPLTFPEYVTPHARDLLRRILVPNPRKRADLFEVARHSWLSEYAHVVELITSATTTHTEIQNTTVPAEDEAADAPKLARSSSARETAKQKPTSPSQIGGLSSKQGATVDPDAEAVAHARAQRDNKRRTVQVEYVAPTTQTQRGGESGSAHPPAGKTRSNKQGPIEVSQKPLPRDPPVSKDPYSRGASQSRRPQSAQHQQGTSSRPTREGQPRANTDNAYIPSTATTRPATGGSMASTRSAGLGARTASIQQPPKANPANYVSPAATQENHNMDFGRPSVSGVPPKFAEVSGFAGEDSPVRERPMPAKQHPRGGHKRSSTLGQILGRSGSIFARKKGTEQQEKPSRKYPPVSMANNMTAGEEPGPRPSIDSRASRRSFSIGFGKKRSGSINGSQTSHEKPKRFSFLKGMMSKDDSPRDYSQPDLPIQDPPMEQYTQYPPNTSHGYGTPPSAPAHHQRFASGQYEKSPRTAVPQYLQQGAMLNTGSDSSVDNTQRRPPQSAPYQSSYPDEDGQEGRPSYARGNSRGALQKNKRFDAYGQEDSYGRDHAGSSGPAKKVMDFFRRRGRARGGEDH